MQIHAKVTMDKMKGRQAEVAAFFYFPNGNPLKDFGGGYNTPNGSVAVADNGRVADERHFECERGRGTGIFAALGELRGSWRDLDIIAVGIGPGFAILLRANPYKGHERGVAQAATAEALREIAKYNAARCCQRDCWIALRVAARLSRRLLPVPLEASESLLCEQAEQNRECMGSSCPLWPSTVAEADAVALG